MSHTSSNKSSGNTERDGRLTDVPLQPYMTSATHQDPGATPTSQFRLLPDGTRVLTESDCYERTGYMWPERKTWLVLTIIFA
ncbi:hypothetical protein LTS18_008536, partial [Coniosporium uncinatum]